MNKKVLTYIAVTIFSLVLLFFWNRYAIDGAEIFAHSAMSESARIISVEDESATQSGDFTSTLRICRAEILSGKSKGNTVKVYQEYNTKLPSMDLADVGDKVIIKNYPMEEMGIYWAVDTYERTPVLLFLGIIFIFLIILLAKTKGLRTVISLIYTCIAVFAVFVPSVLSGKNIYLCAVFICMFIIAMTLLLVNGCDRKTLCATLGCIGGVLAAALVTSVFSKVMKFSGYTNEHSYYLTNLPHPVDLGAIAFSAVIIGAVGAVMDVAMSMASSLYELKLKAEGISFKSLVSSGLSIGRDMMGTMANTLVLAYVGSSLSSVLLLCTYADSMADIFNRELIAHEILQAVAGSIGIVLTIPLTALVCGLVYLKGNGKH